MDEGGSESGVVVSTSALLGGLSLLLSAVSVYLLQLKSPPQQVYETPEEPQAPSRRVQDLDK
ncbi:hypothetical protein PM082_008568 [Marasmius tenuissimus]|nr:hypothetical protein PM082_008568 [Marasmius tenuissimus]